MSGGAAHLLRASVVSSVALRPSTVYVLRVERRPRGVWHVRRCFAEFCELRDKLLAAATAFRVAGDVSGRSSSDTNSPTSDGSHEASPIAGPTRPQEQPQARERLAFLLEDFPSRRRFWSRSIVRRRATALNAFLQQALEFAREARASQQIAVYFSVATHLEAFLDCTKHADDAFQGDSVSWGGEASPSLERQPQPTLEKYPVAPSSSSSECKAGRWLCAADRWHSDSDSDHDSDSETEHYGGSSTLHARRHKTSPTDSDKGVDEELLVVGLERSAISQYLCTRPRISHPFDSCGDDDERGDRHSDMSGATSEVNEVRGTHLRKAASAVLPRETREMRLYYTGSHYASLQNGQEEGITASVAWAARVEFAGIRSLASKQDAPLRAPVPIHPRTSRRRNQKSVVSAVGRDNGIALAKETLVKNGKAGRLHRLAFSRAVPVEHHPDYA